MGKLKSRNKPKRNVKHFTYIKDLQQYVSDLSEREEYLKYRSSPFMKKPNIAGNYADLWDAPSRSQGHQRRWKNQKKKRQYK